MSSSPANPADGHGPYRDEDHDLIRSEIRRLCDDYGNEYWRSLEPDTYPEAFVSELTERGWLGSLVPVEYGGGGLTVGGASVILEEISASGGNPSACHAQMYIMGTLLRHGSDEQKQKYLPQIADGRKRLQAFAVTEPTAGSETTAIRTRAVKVARPDGEVWRINGQKIWTSRALYSDLMLLLARTDTDDGTVRDEKEAARASAPTLAGGGGGDRLHGMSTFLFDIRDEDGNLLPGLTINPIETMMNHNSTEVFFDDVEIPADSLVGVEGNGFRQILDGMNAERILIAAECIGDGRFFLDRASAYARERVVFGRPIGMNQGVAFPLAKAYAHLEAADLMRWKAAELFDTGRSCGAEANMAKMLASEASWEAGNAALNTHGGFGFAVEYDIERKLRETRLYQVAPINNNLVLAFVAQKCLGLPKSY